MPTTESEPGTQSPVSGINPPAKVAIANPLQVDVFDPQRQPLVRWLQRLEGAFRVFQITEDTERAAYLLHFMGVEPFGILCDRLDPVDPYTQSYKILIEKLKEFYAPEPLEIAEIYVYRKRIQLTEESVQEYMAALQKLSLYCKFGDYLQMELRNQFVFGLKNQRIQSRLLETANLTKDSALKIACGMELAEKGVNKLKEENPSETAVDYIGEGAKQKKTKGREERKGNKGSQQQGSRKDSSTTNRFNLAKHNKYTNNKRSFVKSNDIICYRCGQAHLAPNCTLPRSVKCRECGGFGHLQKVCKKKGQANLLEEVFRVDDQEHLEHRAKFTVPLTIENKRIRFDVDCGSARYFLKLILSKHTCNYRSRKRIERY
ncbi:Gag-Pol polyprotein [Cyphomyrmex costatus]|uniref:Gag-Pol polyprotein n=1 Tax=Cyphomyrmex costatus TaxID=456900 RepID=A0A151I8W2_9HYME|nr:Gag-Pol polyprotein [Cyphomyrmex costatus]